MLSLIVSVVLAAAPAPTPLPLPGGEAGIGFDDLGYAPQLHRVLVPAGRTGRLDLIDPASHAIESIGGFSAEEKSANGHGAGTTSVDAAPGLLFASDRSRKQVDVVDLAQKAIVFRAPLASGPDYVRYVAPTREVWVTEPSRKRIEIFKVQDGPVRLVHSGEIAFPEGPESLVIDATRGRAYSHSWGDVTYAIDIKSRAIVEQWKNHCQGARGIALDAERGWLFAGCEEGKATVVDTTRHGALLGEAAAGKGVDIIAYAPALRHLYVPGGEAQTLTVLAVGAQGALSPLGTVHTADDASCVTTDEQRGIYVCDPRGGRLLYIRDTFGP